MVHALSLGSPHKLGIEDGLGGDGREVGQSEAATSTLGSSQVLTLDYFDWIDVDHLAILKMFMQFI